LLCWLFVSLSCVKWDEEGEEIEDNSEVVTALDILLRS
jgi:hypothetical protein